jgi:D-threo-aldose 1-dehydrogenase
LGVGNIPSWSPFAKKHRVADERDVVTVLLDPPAAGLESRDVRPRRVTADELLPLCADGGVPVLAAGVFNSGVLAGSTTFEYATAAPEVVARRDALAVACARFDVPLAAAAIQFPLRNPAVASIVVGARSAAEIADDVRLLDVPVPDELWHELVG